MKKETALKILKEVQAIYEASALEFSQRREVAWPEMDFLFKKYVKKNDSVLDLGCGNARFFSIIQKQGGEYIGLDNSKKLIALAKLKNPEAKFIIGDVLKLPFQKNTFQIIYGIAILHHIPSVFLRQKFLEECKRVLKPKGLLVITAWNLFRKKKKKFFKHFFKKIFLGSNLDFKDLFLDFSGLKNCYLHCFTLRELEKLVENTGFILKEKGFINQGKTRKANLYLVVQKR